MEEQICNEAMQWARAMLTYKSSNKSYGAATYHFNEQGVLKRTSKTKWADTDSATKMPYADERAVHAFYQKRVLSAFEARRKAKIRAAEQMQPTDRDYKEVQEKIKVIRTNPGIFELGETLAAKAGNCGDYSTLALAYILAYYPNYVATRVQLRPPGDHEFVVVWREQLRRHLWGDAMNLWPSGIWVCDPWAKLVCPAKEYYEKFTKKMDKWKADGKRILYKGEWLPPNDVNYIGTIKSTLVQRRWVGEKPSIETLKDLSR
jgi:hypothetical protein